MGHPSSRKGTNLESRDYVRCCIALDFMNEREISSETLKNRYYDSSDAESALESAEASTSTEPLKPGSFHKTFKRDREELEKIGLYLTERKDGSSKIWTVDETRSYATVANLSENDRRLVARLLQIAMSDPECGSHHTLGSSVAKIGQNGCTTQLQMTQESPNYDREILKTLAEALQQRKPVKILYKATDDKKAIERTLKAYGMFSVGQDMYVVGPRTKDGEQPTGEQPTIRTYNLSRIKTARILKDDPIYSVDPNFSINDYRLLPFEIGPDEPQDITLYIEPDHIEEFKLNARKRGDICFEANGDAYWHADTMRNVEAAARWALEVSAIPTKPQELVDAWKQILEEVLYD